MAEEDFEIDVYGDAEGGQDQQDQDQDQSLDQDQAAEEEYNHTETHEQHPEENHEMDGGDQNGSADYGEYGIDSQNNDQSASASAVPQGTKRKQDDDDRPVDQLATNAVLLSEMQWWDTEDEIREWAQGADCESELKDITFSEHKVNGKSKGQAYVEFTSPQASTAFKRHIEGLQSAEGASTQQRRPSVSFHITTTNPFKTLPKDAPQRQNRDSQGRGAPAGQNFHAGGPVNNFQANNAATGYQGNNYRGRGGYRGGMRGGYNQGYGGNNMHTFNNNNNGMTTFNPMGGGAFNRGGGMGGGFNNRGGPNMRARGGMGMMGGAPMMGGGPMGMGGMMPGMNMMGGGMGMGFNNMPGQFNPGFFGGNQGAGGGGNFGGNQQGGGDWGNPHGTKRARGE